MANGCLIDMKIKGKKEDVKAAVEKITNENIFYRTDICSYDDGEEDGEYAELLCGDCAWSIYSCMLDDNGDRFTTLPELSYKYDLNIEAWGQGTGFGFQEHYLYKDGVEIENEKREYDECWIEDYEPTFEVMLEYYPDITRKEYDELNNSDEPYKKGGFENYCTWNI